ncbi:metallophosphoesterase [Mesorhizobium sp. L48C026A00]|uniref:metallophosphoesterase n=1 Tax=Mesorhizobium sp. L48C026A00 TaxID=1287182 RepID=UPI0003CFB80E|nr:metallophosphoesterase [Mesorhizobium sp. L48C026A00]ESZ10637.1 hypothetical protein X737_31295 [Mesorhizobium sp. L48C026A00]
MKLIHLTDLHLVPAGAMLFGFDPAERMRKTIERINRDHADAELCVVTGDLTDEGDFASYELLREVLQEMRVPIRLLLGNHDSLTSYALSLASRAIGRALSSQSMRPRSGASSSSTPWWRVLGMAR